MKLKLIAASLLIAVSAYGQGAQTPIYNGLLQSDLDAGGFKILSANMADYAGTGLTWNVALNQFEASGGGGGSGTVTSISADFPITITPDPTITTGIVGLDFDTWLSWDTAYADRLKWNGGATGLTAATGRTSLGLVIGTDVEAWLGNPSVTGYVLSSTTGGVRSWIAPAVGGGGAPTTVDYLVGTADAGLSAEIVVGTSPGGELGGTWASPTLDDSVTVASWTLTTPQIAAISNLTGNGFVKTAGGIGTLSVDTATYLTANQAISLTGDVTGGPAATSIATTIADSVTVTGWTLGSSSITALSNLTSNGFVKTSGGVGTLSVDTSTYLTSSSISDTAYAGTWDTVTTIAPSKNAVYDKIETLQPLDSDLTDLAAITGTQGDVIYHNGTDWVDLAPGTNGNQLTTHGAGANPTWDVPGAGGGSGTVTSIDLLGTANQLTVTGTSPITTSGSWTLSIPSAAQLNVARLTNLTTNGFVKTSATDGTLSVDTATYLTSASIDDTVYGAGWNGATTVAPSQNAVYDQMELKYAKAGGALSGSVSISMASPSITLNPVSGASVIDIRGTASTNDGIRLSATGTTGKFLADTQSIKNRADSVTYGTWSSTGLAMSLDVTVPDEAYAVGWDGSFEVPTKNAVYDILHTADTDDDGLVNKLDMGDGLVKVTSNVVGIATSGTDYLGTANISDTAFAGTWNAVTTIAPSKNAVYDYMLLSDTDADGKINVLDLTAGLVETDGSGVVTTATAGTDYVSPTGTETLTNKRVNPRVTTITSNATLSPNGDTTDIYAVSALATAITTISAPTGTPVDGQKLIIRIISDSSVRAISGWNAIYRFSSTLPAPSTTVASTTHTIGFMYNSTAVTWDCLAITANP